MKHLHSVLGGEFVLDLVAERIFKTVSTRILYWRDINTTHFVTNDPHRARLATARRAGLRWELQLFVPYGDFVTDSKRTRHEADFAALKHAYYTVLRYGL